MTTTALPPAKPPRSPVNEPAQRVVLRGIRWETYECLLADHLDQSVPHFAYDQGVLEIMSPSGVHEESNRTVSALVEVIAEEWEIDLRNFGSTTFRRADLGRGFEPDTCFYIQSADRIANKDEIDLAVDPAPDLIIEIDITSPSLPKLPLYASLGVPEVWRVQTGGAITILTLGPDGYAERAASLAFPALTRAVLENLFAQSRTLRRAAWLRVVRDWARQPR